MRRTEGRSGGRAASQRWASQSNGDGVGPQGAALILELQRLRQAFEHEERNEAKPHQEP